MKRLLWMTGLLLIGSLPFGRAAAVCDTLRMTWKAKAKEEKAFSFEGTRGGRYVLYWGDGDTTQVVATGGLNRVAHVYARDASYNVWLCGLPVSDEETGEDYVETAFGMEMQMVAVAGGVFSMGATSEQGADAYD
ncbi:MAG: hypothetical protein K2O01_04585, partial [Bacteroidales bacterium]|nr:hypothetical protein [Bacteroidales bacterium]